MGNKKLLAYAVLGICLAGLWQAWEEEIAKKTAPAPLFHKQVAKKEQPQFKLPESRLISVTTDTLKLYIDKKGGAIVEADLLKHPKRQGESDAPIRLLDHQENHFYVAKSGVVNADGGKTNELVFAAPASAYVLEKGKDQLQVVLEAKDQHKQVIKTFTLTRGKYVIEQTQAIKNLDKTPQQARFYYELTRKPLEGGQNGVLGFKTYQGGAYYTPDKPYTKLSYDTIEKENLNISIANAGWVAFQQRYFIGAWAPMKDKGDHRVYSDFQDGLYTMGILTPEVEIPAGEVVLRKAKIYTGPEVAENLAPVADGLKLTIDYGWLWLFSSALFWLMKHIHNLFDNWGLSIIFVTLFIKMVFYKLSESSYRSMAKMRTLQPQLQRLKEKHGEDRQALGVATMELYKKQKINPLGGCLPIFIQIPFFIALYYVLIESVELRHAPFMLWIKDLSAQDPYFVLPVLMGLSMLVQQRLNPSSPDPVQAKVMMVLPLVFTYMFIHFPAGLVLYWLVNNLLSIAQQWVINQRVSSQAGRS